MALSMANDGETLLFYCFAGCNGKTIFNILVEKELLRIKIMIKILLIQIIKN